MSKIYIQTITNFFEYPKKEKKSQYKESFEEIKKKLKILLKDNDNDVLSFVKSNRDNCNNNSIIYTGLEEKTRKFQNKYKTKIEESVEEEIKSLNSAFSWKDFTALKNKEKTFYEFVWVKIKPKSGLESRGKRFLCCYFFLYREISQLKNYKGIVLLYFIKYDNWHK